MTEQERRALFFKVTGQVYALTSMGIYNAFCKGLEAGYEAGRKDENEACAVMTNILQKSGVSGEHLADAIHARREQ